MAAERLHSRAHLVSDDVERAIDRGIRGTSASAAKDGHGMEVAVAEVTGRICVGSSCGTSSPMTQCMQ